MLRISAKVTTCFMKSLYFLNTIGYGHDLGKYSGNFCLADGKSTGTGEIICLNISPLKSFSFNPPCKIGWPPGQLDKVFVRFSKYSFSQKLYIQDRKLGAKKTEDP